MAIVLKRKKADDEKLRSVPLSHLVSRPKFIYGALTTIGLTALLSGFLIELGHTKRNPLAVDPSASAPAEKEKLTKISSIEAELKSVYAQAASLHAAFLAFQLDNQGEAPSSINQMLGKYLAEPQATGKAKTTWLDTWALKDGVFTMSNLSANTCRALSPYKVLSSLDYGKNGVRCVSYGSKHFAHYHMVDKNHASGYWKLTLTGELKGKLATWRVSAEKKLVDSCDSVEPPKGFIELSAVEPKKTIELCIPQIEVEATEINQGLSLLENEETLTMDFVSKEKPMTLSLQASACDSNTVSVARILVAPTGQQKPTAPINCDLR